MEPAVNKLEWFHVEPRQVPEVWPAVMYQIESACDDTISVDEIQEALPPDISETLSIIQMRDLLEIACDEVDLHFKMYND